MREIGGELYQQFLDAGYKEYECNINSADGMLQKCIYREREGKKLFYIDVFCYDWTKYQELVVKKFSIMPEAQFYSDSAGECPVNVSLNWDIELMTPSKIEEYFLNMFDKMGFVSYE